MRQLATALFLTLLGLGLARADQIEALEGTFEEDVQAIESGPDGLTVKTPARSLALDSVKTIQFRRASTKGGEARLQLTSGDFLRGTVDAGNEDSVGFTSPSLGALKVSLERIRALVPGGRTPTEERALLAKLKPTDEVDWVLLDNGGTVKGSLVRVDAGKVTIDTDAEGGSGMGQLSLDMDKVRLVSIAPLGEGKAPAATGLVGVAHLLDGSELRGEVLGLDSDALTLRNQLGAGTKLSISRKQLSELSLQGGRFAYLSDLEPAEVEQRFPAEFTYEVEVWGYKRDRNVAGGPLRLDGAAFAKGLGVHSYCKLTYRIGKAYSSFKATIGLDDEVKYLGEPGFGGVVFRVLVDGKPAPEFPDGIAIKKGEPARPIAVNLKGKDTLTLVADLDPVSLHVLGRANWADAHLIKD